MAQKAPTRVGLRRKGKVSKGPKQSGGLPGKGCSGIRPLKDSWNLIHYLHKDNHMGGAH